jgi:transcription initiation factor TFIIB
MNEDVTKTKQACPECGSSKLVRDFDRGELICMTCGLVLKDKYFDMGPEWRAFDSDQRDKRGRVGAPMTSHLSLPRGIRETAAIIYRKAVEQNLIRGRSIESVTAACLYAACRQRGVPRTLEEIAEHARVYKKEIGSSYRFVIKELNIKINPTNPVDYIGRFASELGLSGAVQKRAIEILNEAIKLGLTSGRGPMGVAAAALYIASIEMGERRTQRDVSDVAKVTEVTVRNRYKELQEKLGLSVDV